MALSDSVLVPRVAQGMETDDIERGQRRLIDAAMKVPMPNQGHALSAYINMTLLGAQVAALVEYTAPFELDESGTPVMKATYQEILVKHLNDRAALFENASKEAPRIQIAGNIAANGLN